VRALAVAGAVAAVAAVVTPLPDEVAATAHGVQRWAEQAPYRAAETLLAQGQVQAAVDRYRSANQGVSDTRYGLAAALLQEGQVQAALALLTNNEPPDNFEPDIIRGEAARRSGDLKGAAAAFNARPVRVASDVAVDWAWDHLRPPPVSTLDIGSGLDLGYIRGFYAPETDRVGSTYRWTSEDAEIRGVQPASTTRITWSGWRPSSAPAAHVTVKETGQANAPGGALIQSVLPRSASWEKQAVPSGSDSGMSSAPEMLDLAVNGFVPGGSDPRLLGLRVEGTGVGK
jgi:hypothetical protein